MKRYTADSYVMKNAMSSGPDALLLLHSHVYEEDNFAIVKLPFRGGVVRTLPPSRVHLTHQRRDGRWEDWKEEEERKEEGREVGRTERVEGWDEQNGQNGEKRNKMRLRKRSIVAIKD
jgi:hypothetical protein